MNKDKLSVIITGSTGMVGEAMLLVALKSEMVEKVLIVNRKKSGISHPKLKEVLIPDFHNLTEIENDLRGYNACFFCMGVSSVGMKEDVYYDITYNLTMNFAKTILKMNDEMSFIYVSGAGTSSDENAKSWWARIKGKTENDLIKMNFKRVFAYRPGFMKPLTEQKNVLKMYKFVNWLFPIGKVIYPSAFNTIEEVGKSMINICLNGYDKKVIDGNDIRKIAEEF